MDGNSKEESSYEGIIRDVSTHNFLLERRAWTEYGILSLFRKSPNRYLAQLFTWTLSPQGYCYWRARSMGVPLSEEDLFFCEGIIRGAIAFVRSR